MNKNLNLGINKKLLYIILEGEVIYMYNNDCINNLKRSVSGFRNNDLKSLPRTNFTGYKWYQIVCAIIVACLYAVIGFPAVILIAVGFIGQIITCVFSVIFDFVTSITLGRFIGFCVFMAFIACII